MAHLDGFEYIAYLLHHPHESFNVTALEAAIKKNRPDHAPSLSAEDWESLSDEDDTYPILDENTKAEYRDKIDSLNEEIERAATLGENDREESLERQKQQIIDELARNTGLGGKSRSFQTDHEKKRVSIKKLITRAVEKIKISSKPLAKHLRPPILETGNYCSYNPPEPIQWS